MGNKAMGTRKGSTLVKMIDYVFQLLDLASRLACCISSSVKMEKSNSPAIGTTFQFAELVGLCTKSCKLLFISDANPNTNTSFCTVTTEIGHVLSWLRLLCTVQDNNHTITAVILKEVSYLISRTKYGVQIYSFRVRSKYVGEVNC